MEKEILVQLEQITKQLTNIEDALDRMATVAETWAEGNKRSII